MSEIREIVGNTTTTPVPQADWLQTDETKADYIKNKPENIVSAPYDYISDAIREDGKSGYIAIDLLGGTIADFEISQNELLEHTLTTKFRIVCSDSSAHTHRIYCETNNIEKVYCDVMTDFDNWTNQATWYIPCSFAPDPTSGLADLVLKAKGELQILGNLNARFVEEVSEGAIEIVPTAYIIADEFNLRHGDGLNSLQQINSMAISESAVALGENSIAGLKGYLITGWNNDNQTYTVDGNVSREVIGAEYSLQLAPDFYYCHGTITDIIYNNRIKVSNYEIPQEADGANRCIWFPRLPHIGKADLGSGAFAEGYETKATMIGAHSEGCGTWAHGKYSHTEGIGTQAGYAGHAEGTNTEAIGKHAHAEGKGTKAIGDNSHAEGELTQSIGARTHTEGYGTSAIGNRAHAEGYLTTAKGDASHAEGHSVDRYENHKPETESADDIIKAWNEAQFSLAYGSASHVEGMNTLALGLYSHAEGAHTIAKGDYSHAEGSVTKSTGSYSHAEGANTEATGVYSHAEGFKTIAKNGYAHAEGNESKATGVTSHAEGHKTQATGKYSHAEGYETTAEGNYSHAEGNNSKSTGPYSHAEGNATTASGYNSHAEGSTTIASGAASHAGGLGTQATTQAQTAIGQYNAINGEALLIVGNGESSDKPSNAFEVLKNGRATIGAEPINAMDVVNKAYMEAFIQSIMGTALLVPMPTADDEDKILKVIGGVPTWVSPTN